MRYVMILVVFVGVFYACQYKKTVSSTSVWKEFKLEEPLAHVVDSFISEYDFNDLYELYLDRVTSDSCVAILSGCPKQNIEKEKGNIQPIAQIRSNGKKVNVYCGIESFITLINSIPQDSLTNPAKKNKDYLSENFRSIPDLLIRFSKNRVNIEERHADPFEIVYATSVIEFPPPVIKKHPR